MQDQEKRFSFTGSGSEYFRIWIVNLILTILTLGIFSAWAKVRRMQYFYRNTQLNQSSFDYHGKPLAILKGRIIGFGLFSGYYTALKFMPVVGLAIGVLIALIMPYLLVLSFRFRLHNSSYRGLRLGFDGSIKSAYVAFLVLPLLTFLTLYLLAPFTHQRIKSYQYNNSRFGQTPFIFNAKAGAFYKVYFFAFLQFISILVLFALGAYLMLKVSFSHLTKEAILGLFVAVYLLVITATLFVVPYFMARINNLVWNNTELGLHRFRSELSARGLAWIMFSNFIFIVLTLGLFKPFADVRMARYRVENRSLLTSGNIEEFLAGEQQKTAATGTETAEIFDVDLGF